MALEKQVALEKQGKLGFPPENWEMLGDHLKCRECFLIPQAFDYRSQVERGFGKGP